MDGWGYKTIGELCEILDYMRKPVTKRDRTVGPYPYYGATGILDYVNDYIFDEPLVLIGEDGAKWDSGATTAYAVSGKCWVNNHAHVLRPFRDIILDKWLIYYLNHKDLREYTSGLTVPKLNQKNLRSIPIPVPPLPEQQRIVAVLDEAFEGIKKAKANAEKNLQNARALFEGYLQSVFTQRREKWVTVRFGDVCKFIRGPFGGSLKKSIFVPDGYAVYEQKHAIHNHFDGLRYFINEGKFNEMKRFELLPGDLIMSCSGTMGRVAIVPKDIKRGIINQALLKLTPTEIIFNKFLKYWMESNAFQDALAMYSGGAAIKNVSSVKVLKEIIVPLPSKHEQEVIVDNIDSVLNETHYLESIYTKTIAALDELKKTLQDQAFIGKL